MSRTALADRSFWRSNELGLLVAIAVVVLVTILVDPQRTYLHNPLESAKDVLRQTTMLGIFALGSAVVIISGGIDLSCGSVIAFSGTICATFLLLLAPEALSSPKPPDVGWGNISLAIAGTLVVGFMIGSLHAWLITVVGLPPFVATLASLVGLRSLARAIIPRVTEATRGTVSNQIQIADPQFRYLANSLWIPVLTFAVLILFTWLMLSRTVVGRHIYALGGNEEAARLSGIRTDRLKWLAYVVGSLTSSIAGIFYIGEQSVADPQVLGMGYELNGIAAAVVGGCSLQGGIGTIPGTVLGCLFLRTVMDGIAKMVSMGADVYEGIIVGVLVVLAVALGQIKERKSNRRRFFAGGLGWIVMLALALLGGTLTGFVLGRGGAGVGFVLLLSLLVVLRKWESLQARPRQVAVPGGDRPESP